TSLCVQLLQPLREPRARVARRHSLQLAERLVPELPVILRRLKREGAEEADLPALFPGLCFRSLHERRSDSLPARRLVDPEQLDEQAIPEAEADQSTDELVVRATRGEYHAHIVEGPRALLVECKEPVADLVRGLLHPLRLECDPRFHAQSVRRATKIRSPG